MAGKGHGCSGILAFFGMAIVVGLCAWLYQVIAQYWVAFSILGILAVIITVFAIIMAKINKPIEITQCQLCGNPLGRKQYILRREGKEQILCTHCGSAIQRKKSREAIKREFGEEELQTFSTPPLINKPEPQSLFCPECGASSGLMTVGQHKCERCETEFTVNPD